jgi:hypothetical protein
MEYDDIYEALDAAVETHRSGQAAQTHATLIDALEIVLRDFRERGGDIDDWERLYLASALASIQRGLYGLAVIDVETAMVPPAVRGWISQRIPPEIMALGFDDFMRLCREARAWPVEPHPIFVRA